MLWSNIPRGAILLITAHLNDRGNLCYLTDHFFKVLIKPIVVMHHNRSALFLPLTHKVDVKPISGSKKQHLSYGVLSVIRNNDQ